LIQLPEDLKAKLDAKRTQGYTISGYVRTVLQNALIDAKKKKRRRANHE
jgi:hypothetical protein